MNDFYPPPLLISDYYDSLAREIYIYTEELLAEYKQKDTLPPEPEAIFVQKLIDHNVDTRPIDVDDTYTAEYKYEDVKENFQVIPGRTRVREYLRMIREKAIGEFRTAERKSLKKYNQDRGRFFQVSTDAENIETLKRELFDDTFYFLVKIDHFPNYNKKEKKYFRLFNKSIFRLYIIKTDFYLRQSDIDYIRSQFEYELEYSGMRYFARYPKRKLDQPLLLANQVKEYICGLSARQKYGNEIIHIKKKTLLKSQRVDFDNWLFDGIEFSARSRADLTGIKSLYLGNNYAKGKRLLDDLSAFVNLKFVHIDGLKLSQTPFINLNKLVKLTIENCDLSQFQIDSLYSLPYLTVLRIGQKYFYIEDYFNKEKNSDMNYEIDLDNLPSLKWLDIYYVHANTFKIISKHSHNNLRALRLEKIRLNKATRNEDDFFKSLNLPELELLVIKGCILSNDSIDFCLDRFPKLRFLLIKKMGIESLELIQTESLRELEILNISDNIIRVLNKGNFSQLVNLNILDLSDNFISYISPDVFEGLGKLEILAMRSAIDLNNGIENDMFKGLINLKELYLTENELKYIHKDAFIHLPELRALCLGDNSLNLDRQLFSPLKNLKWLNLMGNTISKSDKSKLPRASSKYSFLNDLTQLAIFN